MRRHLDLEGKPTVDECEGLETLAMLENEDPELTRRRRALAESLWWPGLRSGSQDKRGKIGS